MVDEGIVDQVNRPLLIALLATAALAAGWMTFLRPGAVQSTTEQVTAPNNVATQAREAAAATDKASAATEAAADKVADESTATPPTPTSPAPKAKANATATPKDSTPAKAVKADPETAVVKDIDAHKVVVLLFWDKTGADDRAARAAVRGLDLRDGKVAVHAIDVKDVGRYESVTQGVSVTQSPTTMIIAPDAQARTITGLSEPTEVAQLVRAALATK
jgi:hypothetical protein